MDISPLHFTFSRSSLLLASKSALVPGVLLLHSARACSATIAQTTDVHTMLLLHGLCATMRVVRCGCHHPLHKDHEAIGVHSRPKQQRVVVLSG
jgi:hypothetical protein